MVEVMFCMIIFLGMVVVFAAVCPLAMTSANTASLYNQAAAIGQHKIDELRDFNWQGSDMTSGSGQTALQTALVNAKIVDSCSGTTTMTCSFVNSDEIVANGTSTGGFPNGTTATVTITPDTTLVTGNTNGAPPNGLIYNVLVTMNWSGGGVPSGAFYLPAKVIEYQQ